MPLISHFPSFVQGGTAELKCQMGDLTVGSGGDNPTSFTVSGLPFKPIIVFIGSGGYYLGPALVAAFASELDNTTGCVISSDSTKILPINCQFNEDGFTFSGQSMGQSNHLVYIAFYLE